MLRRTVYLIAMTSPRTNSKKVYRQVGNYCDAARIITLNPRRYLNVRSLESFNKHDPEFFPQQRL
jgi:hypothetical protein